jgi:dihydrolipoamide dehydrogenase
MTIQCDLLVLGGGPGGYSAAFRAADLGLSVVLVERYPTLGGVCLNVGCIPSKALLHVAGAIADAGHLSDCGVRFAMPEIDLYALRAHKEKIVGKLTGGLAGMARARKVQHVQGTGKFTGPNTLEVVGGCGKTETVAFGQAIIAVGSRAVKLPTLPDDPRVIDSTGALALPCIPKHMLIIGGGIIGLEMASVYSGLGGTVSVVELGDKLMPGADRDLVKVWEKENLPIFARVLTGTGVEGGKATEEGIEIAFSNGEKAVYDLVLVAVGRAPNGGLIDAEQAGVAVSSRGFIEVDAQMRTNVPHIFAIGDVVGQPLLAH